MKTLEWKQIMVERKVAEYLFSN